MIRTRKIKLIQKAGRFLLVFALISGWLFSGFPQIWREPLIQPKIQEGFLLK